jgi:DNA topoisomerase IB
MMCPPSSVPAIENRRAARKSGLRYVSDADPGIHRKPHGRGFEFTDQRGRLLKCYMHPADIDAYLDRSLLDLLKRRTERELRSGLTKLSPQEAAVLGLLQGRLKKQLATHKRPRRHK